MEFKIFKQAVDARLKIMADRDLFVTDIGKDDLWGTYLGSFPLGHLPAIMRMACSTHIGLSETLLECRLMVLEGADDKLRIGYRINAHDKIKDASAEEFREILSAGIISTGDIKIPLWMGSFNR